jgi:hypothetical protein
MGRGLVLRFSILAAIALAAFLILRSSTGHQSVSNESMDECCQKKSTPADDNNLIWETFSRQFISL